VSRIDLPTYAFDEGLEGACFGGHVAIIDRMIAFGARNYDKGLVMACYGGHRNIVNMMISLGGKTPHVLEYCVSSISDISLFIFVIQMGRHKTYKVPRCCIPILLDHNMDNKIDAEHEDAMAFFIMQRRKKCTAIKHLQLLPRDVIKYVLLPYVSHQ